MKLKRVRLVAAAACLVTLCTGCISTTQRTMWQYRVMTASIDNLERDLNRLGTNGWEAVAGNYLGGNPSLGFVVLKKPGRQ